MADAAPRYAHIFRTGIFGYIWLGPVACHLNMGVMNMAYKYLLRADAALAAELAKPLIFAFCVPAYVLLLIMWLPAVTVQFKAFAEGLTPYPKKAKRLSMPVGMLPALIIGAAVGPSTALGGAIGTTFISLGSIVVFGGRFFHE